MSEWLSLADAALARGVCVQTIRNAVHDGKITWRWGRHPTRPARARIEVWWPDVSGCVFPRAGGGWVSSGPVTDETWARFCAVTDRLIQQAQERDRA